MKKTVLIAFTCDPYLALHAKELHDLYWGDEVDEINIHINGTHPFIIEFIKNVWKDSAKTIIVRDKACRQGSAFNQLYSHADGDILITLDSDNFIYKKGVITKFCALIEGGEYDYVGSYNPFMSFWRKEIVDRIDHDFSCRMIKKGEDIAEFGGLQKKDAWRDVMQIFTQRFFGETSRARAKIIPIDEVHEEGTIPAYVHIGRQSPFAIFVSDYPKERKIDKVLDITKGVRKSFLRPNRMGYIYYMFKKYKDSFPYEEYNDFYERTFLRIAYTLTFTNRNLKDILVHVQSKLPKELKLYE